MNIFTIGYEGSNINSVIDILLKNKIDSLVDVRLTPLSRKAGFSKSTFESYLQECGIEYVHMKSLGCPNPIRNQYKVDGNWATYTTAYKCYLETQESSILELVAMALSSSCCLLCFEREADFCHRSFVANRVCEVSNGMIKRYDLYPSLSNSSPIIRTVPSLPEFVYL